uniref:Uncharacterized protein n=1 Tax=Anguilla anguilla TaxID=7936 RepID=A0A0E9SME5_ANGAN
MQYPVFPWIPGRLPLRGSWTRPRCFKGSRFYS